MVASGARRITKGGRGNPKRGWRRSEGGCRVAWSIAGRGAHNILAFFTADLGCSCPPANFPRGCLSIWGDKQVLSCCFDRSPDATRAAANIHHVGSAGCSGQAWLGAAILNG